MYYTPKHVLDMIVDPVCGAGAIFTTTTATSPDVPTSGDGIWIEQPNTPNCRAWHAKPEHPPRELSGVTRVDDEGEHFVVHADRKPAGSIYGQPQPYSVRVKRDVESQPGLLRGTVTE